ncbi:Carboxymethylenebutenolidase-like [Hondaea fermentalgiana]|uniref:Carboxymethylenebutenolidase-like n=1 Tax=Hondaea fermentalgiana TaxID=2315210 RepID=A0A2R5G6K3_9STRA|nr:Carboxymethylenebutenolidase-like [Hondaea fermentalgiana]|eukprot:GBG25418.1 Carboxymethylenebutenolidase-like [Hondaea fermentalgiana]
MLAPPEDEPYILEGTEHCTMQAIKKTVGDIPVLIYKGTSSKGGLVLIQYVQTQEWWGITEELKLQAQHVVAYKGCTVLLPDLYNGKSTLDAEEAHHLMDNLDWPKAVEGLGKVAQHLKEEEGCENVGVMGFCMGGALATAASVNCTGEDGKPIFACGLPFYGIPPKELADPATLKVPLSCHFGGRDNMEGFSDPPSQDKFEEALKESKTDFEFFRYPTVGHAFMNSLPDSVSRKKELGQIGDNDDDPKHDPESISTAWARAFSFLQKYSI